MATKSTITEVPFDRDGNLMSYPISYYGPHWESAEPFEDTLKFVYFQRGRSAAHAIFKSETTGHTYPMFLTHFAALVQEGVGAGGVVSGKWAYSKRGMNYSIKRG